MTSSSFPARRDALRVLSAGALAALAVMSFSEVARETEVEAVGMVEVEYAAA